MTAFKVAGCAFVLFTILRSSEGIAQFDQAISAKDLVDPWNRARAVLLSLAHSFDIVEEQDKRSRLDHDLSALDDGLSALQAQQETVAIRIASNPGFVYDAPASSVQMSRQVSLVGESFDLLFRDLMLQHRPDVLATQDSIEALRQALSDRNRLERDVIRAFGSGGRNQIQALAGAWWTGAESVSGVRQMVAEAQRRLSASPRH